MSGLCDGRVVIATGAGRGIGSEHALMLASEGAKVVVNDLGGEVDGTGGDKSPAQQVVEEIKAMGAEAIANGDDVSDWEGSQRMVNMAIETFGGLDAVVNNAGWTHKNQPLLDVDEATFDRVYDSNVKSIVHMIHAVVPMMRRARRFSWNTSGTERSSRPSPAVSPSTTRAMSPPRPGPPPS